jgi:hypothetical protein
LIGCDLTLNDLYTIMKSRFDLSCLIVEEKEDASQFSSLADVCIKFGIIHGTLVLECVLPSEGLFGLECSETGHELQLTKLL